MSDSNKGSKANEGYIPFTVQGETYKTFYKLYGSLGDRVRNPLIVLHGGPGLCHNYLISFGDLALKYNVPVIIYDQLGNGKSTHLREKPVTFWNIDLFIDELENLLKYFSIQDGFDLAGHSWGGVLAAEFEVRRQPTGLRHLILTNSIASYALWMESTMQLMANFPDDVKQGLIGGMKDPVAYHTALKAFHAVHGCTIRPIPEEYWQTLEEVFGPSGDPTVAAAPILENWSIIDRLHSIRVPTFVINGRKDIAQDFVVQPFFEKIPKVKWVTFENSGHSSFIEERDKFMHLTSAFLAA